MCQHTDVACAHALLLNAFAVEVEREHRWRSRAERRPPACQTRMLLDRPARPLYAEKLLLADERLLDRIHCKREPRSENIDGRCDLYREVAVVCRTRIAEPCPEGR